VLRSQGNSFQERWFKLDLQAKQCMWFSDQRETRASLKGSFPLSEITLAKVPPNSRQFDFLVCTSKRNHHMRTPSADVQEFWVSLINNVMSATEGRGYVDLNMQLDASQA
jgi:hypothetical protein